MKSVVIGTAGHIDHGKSALVWALTGTDPDRLKEEKARGITIDLGFANWSAGDRTFAFVDVPGHERFVRHMLAGVGGVDFVLLVIAADESVMPQTREHFEICRLLEVPAGLVVLTKADLVDDETLQLVHLEARELVAGSFLDDAPMVAVSSKTGAGLDDLRRAIVDLGDRVPGRPVDGAARLPIDRVFSVKGFGTVVTGTLVSGTLAADQDLLVLPPGRPAKVRGLQVHGSRAESAVAGQRVAVNLGGIDHGDLARGDTLTHDALFVPTRRLDAVIELVSGARRLAHGSRVRFHQGTAEVMGRVAVVGVSGRSGTASAPGDERPVGPPGEVPAGGRASVRIRLEAPVVVTRGDRFILRAYSPPVTIGGGLVLDPQPPRAGVRTAGGRARFEALDFRTDAGAGREGRDQADLRAASLMIRDAGVAAFPVGHLVSRMGVAPGRAEPLAARLVAAGHALRVGDLLVDADLVDRLRRSLLDLVGEHHRAAPLSDGLPREEARARLCARAPVAVFDRILAELAAAGTLVVRDRLALATHQLVLSPEEDRISTALVEAFRSAGLKPPEVAALHAELGASAPVVEKLLKWMVRQRVLVRIDALLFHRDALQQLRQDLAALKEASGGAGRIDVATFKERYGISRKYAIPLLEYLDRERVTRRHGDSRVLL